MTAYRKASGLERLRILQAAQERCAAAGYGRMEEGILAARFEPYPGLEDAARDFLNAELYGPGGEGLVP